ncbi:MAG: hypothetical protein U0997_06600 [Sulfurimicrobium sp.]|nr:hypothetical protein [Sulfurimicrobium sp.]
MRSGKLKKQVVRGNVDQLAARDIHNRVHVEVNLNSQDRQEAWCTEIDLHKRFKKELGIECSYPARHELSRLLTNHNFTPRQIKIAWRNLTLSYDDELKTLVSSPSKIEAGLGGAFFLLGLLMVLPGVEHFILTPKADVFFLPAFALYVGMVAVLSNQLIAPYRIGKRLERVLKSVNSGGSNA